MHVNFSLTQNYILENEKNRVAKTLELFNKFIESVIMNKLNYLFYFIILLNFLLL